MKDTVKILKWVTGGLEAILGFPFVGGTIVLSLFWTPLMIMLALHIVTLVYAKKEGLKATGNILGIITSSIGWIPVLGMIMHIISAIFILIEAFKQTTEPPQEPPIIM